MKYILMQLQILIMFVSLYQYDLFTDLIIYRHSENVTVLLLMLITLAIVTIVTSTIVNVIIFIKECVKNF